MKFNKLVEDFNVFPKPQYSIQSGPDIGTTRGKPNDTFPSRMEVISGNILPDEVRICVSKDHAKSLIKALSSALKES